MEITYLNQKQTDLYFFLYSNLIQFDKLENCVRLSVKKNFVLSSVFLWLFSNSYRLIASGGVLYIYYKTH